MSVWEIGNNLNHGRYEAGGCGTQTAGLCFGGRDVDGVMVYSEEYNGSTWSAGGNLGTARKGPGGCGTQTAAVTFAGVSVASGSDWYIKTTEEYNGTSWAAGNDMINLRYFPGGCGTQTAALGMGGYPANAAPAPYAKSTIYHCEEYDGTTWTATDTLSQGRGGNAGAGTQTAGLSIGGEDSGGVPRKTTEEYDGAAWSDGGWLITERRLHAAGGTQSAGMAWGGFRFSNTHASTETYNGTSWAAGPNLNYNRGMIAGFGSLSVGAVSCGGAYTISVTERFLPIEYLHYVKVRKGSTTYTLPLAATSDTGLTYTFMRIALGGTVYCFDMCQTTDTKASPLRVYHPTYGVVSFKKYV